MSILDFCIACAEFEFWTKNDRQDPRPHGAICQQKGETENKSSGKQRNTAMEGGESVEGRSQGCDSVVVREGLLEVLTF